MTLYTGLLNSTMGSLGRAKCVINIPQVQGEQIRFRSHKVQILVIKGEFIEGRKFYCMTYRTSLSVIEHDLPHPPPSQHSQPPGNRERRRPAENILRIFPRNILRIPRRVMKERKTPAREVQSHLHMPHDLPITSD